MTNKRKYSIAALIVLALVAVNLLLLWRRSQTQTGNPATTNDSVSESTPLLPADKMVSAAKGAVDFPDAAKLEIEKCLGRSADGFNQLEELAASLAGEPEGNELEWRVVQFEDQTGQHYRIRLANEFTEAGKRQLTLSLFSVDSDGLPDRMPLPASESRNPDLEAMNRVLHDKRVVNDLNLNRYRYSQGQEIAIERENGIIQKFTYTGAKTRLSCDAAQGNPTCHCVR